MHKIKLNERQILMLQKLQENKPKNKLIKINEDQYKRLFKGGTQISKNLDKSIQTNDLQVESDENKNINLLEFAQEIIVFIKDVLKDPKNVVLSPYWDNLDISKGKLFRMLKKEGLLSLSNEANETKQYITPKLGFRKKIKELYNKVNSKDMVNEFGGDGGYPAGAEHDPRAPWNQPEYDDDDHEYGKDSIKADKEILKLIYFSNEMDDVAIFTDNKKIFVIVGETLAHRIGDDLFPYEDIEEEIDSETMYNYVNDKLSKKEIKIYSSVNALNEGYLCSLTPEIVQHLMKYYGRDEKLVSIIRQIPESTTATSSGSFVTGAAIDNPIIRKGDMSPEHEMDRINENGIDSSYTHFLVYKNTGKLCGGWDYSGSDVDDIKIFAKEDIKSDFPNFKVSDFKLMTKRGIEKMGINPFDSNNWENPVMNEGSVTEENNPWAICTASVGRDDKEKYEACVKKVKTQYGIKSELEETTDSAQVGGDSGSFVYDAPAGDGSSFWVAGNKENKKLKENLQKGQIYKKGPFRRRVDDFNPENNTFKVRQWGDGEARYLNLTSDEFNGWMLIEGKKILKISETQLKKILENNLTSTAYPKGKMVSFDDCTKLNNNKAAQNGGCNQGAINNVAKYKETKDSVVSEAYNIINENNSAKELVPLFVKAIDEVDENLSYAELAEAIAYIINDYYGSHLVELFLKRLNDLLMNK